MDCTNITLTLQCLSVSIRRLFRRIYFVNVKIIFEFVSTKNLSSSNFFVNFHEVVIVILDDLGSHSNKFFNQPK